MRLRTHLPSLVFVSSCLALLALTSCGQTSGDPGVSGTGGGPGSGGASSGGTGESGGSGATDAGGSGGGTGEPLPIPSSCPAWDDWAPEVQTAVIAETGVDAPAEHHWRGVVSVFVVGASHLEGVQCLPALEALRLETSSVASLAPLSESMRLTSVLIDSDQLKDLSPLSGNEYLSRLSVTNAPVDSWDLVSGFRNLRFLYLANVSSFTMSELSSLDNLEWLSITSVPVDNLAVLDSLSALRGVELIDTQISNVSVLLSLEADLQQVTLGGDALRSETFTEDIPALLGQGVCVEWTDAEGMLHQEPESCFNQR